jgi:hypothetical protein
MLLVVVAVAVAVIGSATWKAIVAVGGIVVVGLIGSRGASWRRA